MYKLMILLLMISYGINLYLGVVAYLEWKYPQPELPELVRRLMTI